MDYGSSINFDQRTINLLALVLQNRAAKAIEILRSKDYDNRILTDIGCFDHPFPLYQITMCNAILTQSNDWIPAYQAMMDKHHEQCSILQEFWKKEFGYPVYDEFDFSLYEESGHFIDWDIEDLLEGNLDELTAMGYNRNEAEFCYATLVYDVPLLRKHLRLGTRPDVYISADFSPDQANIRDGSSYHALNFCTEVICDAYDYNGLNAIFFKEHPVTVTPILLKFILEAAAYSKLRPQLQQLAQRR